MRPIVKAVGLICIRKEKSYGMKPRLFSLSGILRNKAAAILYLQNSSIRLSESGMKLIILLRDKSMLTLFLESEIAITGNLPQ